MQENFNETLTEASSSDKVPTHLEGKAAETHWASFTNTIKPVSPIDIAMLAVQSSEALSGDAGELQ